MQNKFAATGNMITARAGHSAVLLNNGDVMMIGGASGSVGGGTSTAELQLAFDTGVNGAMLNSTEIFDPTTGTFAPGGSADGRPRCYERDRRAARDRWTDDSADFNADGFAHQRHSFRDANLDANSHSDGIAIRYSNDITNSHCDAITNRYGDSITNADTDTDCGREVDHISQAPQLRQFHARQRHQQAEENQDSKQREQEERRCRNDRIGESAVAALFPGDESMQRHRAGAQLRCLGCVHANKHHTCIGDPRNHDQ